MLLPQEVLSSGDPYHNFILNPNSCCLTTTDHNLSTAWGHKVSFNALCFFPHPSPAFDLISMHLTLIGYILFAYFNMYFCRAHKYSGAKSARINKKGSSQWHMMKDRKRVHFHVKYSEHNNSSLRTTKQVFLGWLVYGDCRKKKKKDFFGSETQHTFLHWALGFTIQCQRENFSFI